MSPEHTFRIATQADAPVIAALVESAYRGDASRAGWTTEADFLHGRRTDVTEIEELLTSENGRFVLFERIAREEWACARVEMTVIDIRAELIAWYERRGYVRTGRTKPFPYGDERFGIPQRDDLRFEYLSKDLRA
jgi:hypothetical protein